MVRTPDHGVMGIRVNTRVGRNTSVSFPWWVPILAVLCGLGLVVELVRVLWMPLLILAVLAVALVVWAKWSVARKKRRGTQTRGGR